MFIVYATQLKHDRWENTKISSTNSSLSIIKLVFHFSVAKRSVFHCFVNTQAELMILTQYSVYQKRLNLSNSNLGRTIKFLRGGLSKYQKKIRARKKNGKKKYRAQINKFKKKSSKLFKVAVVKSQMIYWRKYQGC